MCKLLAEQVFKPGSFPEYTYVSRKSLDLGIDYEVRLKQALKIAGFLTSIVGPSKMGKTILCEKVIGLDNLVEVSGVDFKVDSDFWSVVAAKVGMSVNGEFTENRIIKDNNSDSAFSKTEIFSLTKDMVIDYFKKKGKVLVLDDFHYAPDGVYIAQQLKDAIRKEFKAIVVSLPHRADDAIRKNADLSGRLSLVNIEPWSNEELETIAITGFNKLSIKIKEDIAQKIAVESLTSPQLMQHICLSICSLLNTDDCDVKEIPETILEKAYRYTTINFEYADVMEILKLGPNPRGNKRNLYKTISGKESDIYGLIIDSIAANPPMMGLSLDDIKARIDKLIPDTDKKPEKTPIRESLNKLQAIIDEKENIYKVFEWKDGVLYILDPLFLFYLRWGKH